MIKASIDIGSNTALLLIAQYDGKTLKELESRSTVTALGKNLDENKEFLQDSMEATYFALSNYLDLIKKYEILPQQVIVTATEASRVALNAPSFYQKVEKELGLKVQIITSEGEAYYTAKGVCLNLKSQHKENSEVTLMDIGGASTELIKVKPLPFEYESSVSLPFGSVRATNWLRAGSFEQRVSDIFQNVKEIDRYKTNNVVCVAGTMTALGGMILGLSDFEGERINGYETSYANFYSFVEKIKNDSSDKILEHYPFLGKRAESIVGGALLACRTLEKLGVENLEVSTSGLRHGTLMASEGIEPRFRAGAV